MSTYVIDLNAKFVPETVRIWRMFPGKSYIALPLFLEKNVVFLDLPALELPLETSGNHPIPQLRERIAMARAHQEWFRVMRKQDRSRPQYEVNAGPRILQIGKDTEQVDISTRYPVNMEFLHKIRAPKDQSIDVKGPSKNISDYKNVASKISGSDIGSVLALFKEAKAGDLVIVPDRYGNRKVHVGEFLKGVDFREEIKMERYGDEPLLARPVKWYPAIDEGSLPKTLTEKLRLPNPMSLLEKEEYKRVFDEVYKTYYTENEFCSRFYTKSEDFTTNDNLYFNALTRAISKLLLDADESSAQKYKSSVQETDTFLELAFSLLPADYEASISCSIHSPGFLELKAGKPVPLVVAAIFSLLWAAEANAQPKPENIIIQNSANLQPQKIEDDECVVHVSIGVKKAIDRMNFPVWQDACEKAKILKNNTKMTSSPHVKRPQNDSSN